MISKMSYSVEETKEIAAKLAETIQNGAIIALKGDLGAGKTIFVRGFCAELGVDPDEVNSPTFTIVNEYPNSIYHIDAYRLENSDPEDIGIWDYINNGKVTIIEWCEYIDVDYDVVVTIKGSGDEPREITYEHISNR